jgi:hypothetical protein
LKKRIFFDLYAKICGQTKAEEPRPKCQYFRLSISVLDNLITVVRLCRTNLGGVSLSPGGSQMKPKFWIFMVALSLVSASPAWADGVTVFTGYHDGLRAGGFFPNPWIGDTFDGQPILVPGGLLGGSDDGAILIVNTTGTPQTISNITVDSFQNGASFSLWPTFTLAAGQAAILTATFGDNFDTSDQPIQCTPSGAIPQVHITVGGTPETLSDTGQRLNTGGTDIAICSNPTFVGPNESIGWALIGTVAGQGNNISTPEPASLLLMGTGLLGVCALRRKFQA